MQPQGRARHTVPYRNAPFINSTCSVTDNVTFKVSKRITELQMGGENSTVVTLYSTNTIYNTNCFYCSVTLNAFTFLYFLSPLTLHISFPRLTELHIPMTLSLLFSSPLFLKGRLLPGLKFPWLRIINVHSHGRMCVVCPIQRLEGQTILYIMRHSLLSCDQCDAAASAL